MLVQRLGQLRGLSLWPHHFAALGLQPARVAHALDAACAQRAATELLAVRLRHTRETLGELMRWLLSIVRRGN